LKQRKICERNNTLGITGGWAGEWREIAGVILFEEHQPVTPTL
jgi:hypothetical protein